MTAPGDLSRLLSIHGKTALVTGGGGGIGTAIVALFLEAGARVFSLDRPGRGAAPGSIPLECDLADAAAIAALFEEGRRPFDRLDILVHAAGITRDAILWKMEDAAWTEVLRINLDAAFHLLKRSAPLLRAAGDGAVVLIASINGERGKAGQANYAASKAGLIGLGRTAARELGRSGVRVNLIAPGLIDTPMTASLPEEVRARAIEESALGRAGQPDDVARAALFLCAPLGRHIAGQVLRVDGGQLIG